MSAEYVFIYTNLLSVVGMRKEVDGCVVDDFWTEIYYSKYSLLCNYKEFLIALPIMLVIYY